MLHTCIMTFIQRALDLAEMAAGSLAPRPPVGAVIVASDQNTIVGQGATKPNPGPHAEAIAIATAKDSAKGGSIYCTLEPHQNNSTTPPCTQAIIDAGIKRVICPTVDPNPQVNGRGFEHLREAGIEVINQVDETSQRRADELIEGFAKHIKTGMPFVTVKWAMSLDGKIATRDRDSKWITNQYARAHAHRLRYRSDAVITGIGTVIADDPRLTARDPQTGQRMHGRPYVRVVVDSHARMPHDAALLEEDGEVMQIVADENTASVPFAQRKGTRTSKASAQGMPKGRSGHPRRRVIALPNCDNKSVDLTAVVRHLGERGCVNVLAEAGEKLTGELFDLQLVDKVVAYLSTSKIIGGSQALTPVGGKGPSVMSESARLHNTRIEHLGNDIAVIGYVDYAQETEPCSAA